MSKDYTYLLDILSTRLTVENYDEKTKSLNTVCPFCGKPNFHFAINLQKGVYNCFKCQTSGHISRLLRYLGIQIIDTPVKDTESLEDTVKGFFQENSVPEDIDISKYFKSISEPLRPAHLQYLQGRGISKEWASYYGIKSGKRYSKLSNYILIPDNPEDIHYYTARSVSGGLRYINPPGNIANVDDHIFNLRKNFPSTIILTEGVFTAMAVNRFFNKSIAVALYGKLLKRKQFNRILSLKPQTILICFDADAIENSFKWAQEFLNNNITTYIISVPPFKGPHTDVADITDEQFIQCLNSCQQFTRFSTLNLLKGGIV